MPCSPWWGWGGGGTLSRLPDLPNPKGTGLESSAQAGAQGLAEEDLPLAGMIPYCTSSVLDKHDDALTRGQARFVPFPLCFVLGVSLARLCPGKLPKLYFALE